MKKKETLEIITNAPVPIASLAGLKDYLAREGVDWRSWKTRKTKTIEDLFELLESKTAEIHEGDNGPILLLLDVGIDVVYRFSDEITNIIVEKERKFSDETVPEERKTRHTLVSKVAADRSTAETARDAIANVLKHKKNKFAVVVRLPGTPYFDAAKRYHRSKSAYKDHFLLVENEPYELDTETDKIGSFPGLEHRRMRKVILCIVPQSAYKHHYRNVHRGKKSLFESILLRDKYRFDPHFTMRKYEPLRAYGPSRAEAPKKHLSSEL